MIAPSRSGFTPRRVSAPFRAAPYRAVPRRRPTPLGGGRGVLADPQNNDGRNYFMLKACVVCGSLSDGARCPEHRVVQVKASPDRRGYDATWKKLSRRARQLQPFCLDCGTTEDLTTDHTPEAWERKLAGKVIRLEDVAVVCRGCNARRGAARPGAGQVPRNVPGGRETQTSHARGPQGRGVGATDVDGLPLWQPKFSLDTPGGYR